MYFTVNFNEKPVRHSSKFKFYLYREIIVLNSVDVSSSNNTPLHGFAPGRTLCYHEENALFALRVELGGLYMFACINYVTLDMNGACQTYENC